MTEKQSKLVSLKGRQQKKKSQIESYKKQAKKRLFIFSLTLALLTLFFLDSSYKVFGTLENFVIIMLSILFGVVIFYNLIVFLLIRKRKKEIKRISRRMHRLMKLEKDGKKKEYSESEASKKYSD